MIIVFEKAAQTAAMALAEGHFQMGLLTGTNDLSLSNLSKKWAGSYAKSRANLLNRMTEAGIVWGEAGLQRGYRVLALGRWRRMDRTEDAASFEFPTAAERKAAMAIGAERIMARRYYSYLPQQMIDGMSEAGFRPIRVGADFSGDKSRWALVPHDRARQNDILIAADRLGLLDEPAVQSAAQAWLMDQSNDAFDHLECVLRFACDDLDRHIKKTFGEAEIKRLAKLVASASWR
jgi:hypothetical protein